MSSHPFLNAPRDPSRLRWLFAALSLAALLAGLEGWAVADHLYWRYVWSDTVMHFLGGMMSGSLAVGLLRTFRPLRFILVVAVIAFGWEAYEIAIGTPHALNYAFDTSLDLLMDALGALLIYAIARRTIWR
ncbi:MAG: hypothetical protein KGI41_03795 [Patescibacteria group bacterium]|nr:hypothetical protein [Patescibacteria group bacterium]MDE1966334.1 hypothetical protein [Patescibacteria group bacterium]